jgi:hypothetical protein
MATYKQIIDYVRKLHNTTVQTCWIAHVKELSGLNPNQAPNRILSTSRTKPCPDDNVKMIEDALRHFDMIE